MCAEVWHQWVSGRWWSLEMWWLRWSLLLSRVFLKCKSWYGKHCKRVGSILVSPLNILGNYLNLGQWSERMSQVWMMSSRLSLWWLALLTTSAEEVAYVMDMRARRDIDVCARIQKRNCSDDLEVEVLIFSISINNVETSFCKLELSLLVIRWRENSCWVVNLNVRV